MFASQNKYYKKAFHSPIVLDLKHQKKWGNLCLPIAGNNYVWKVNFSFNSIHGQIQISLPENNPPEPNPPKPKNKICNITKF